MWRARARAHARTHTYAHTHTHTHTHTHARAHTHTHAHTHTQSHTYTHSQHAFHFFYSSSLNPLLSQIREDQHARERSGICDEHRSLGKWTCPHLLSCWHLYSSLNCTRRTVSRRHRKTYGFTTQTYHSSGSVVMFSSNSAGSEEVETGDRSCEDTGGTVVAATKVCLDLFENQSFVFFCCCEIILQKCVKGDGTAEFCWKKANNEWKERTWRVPGISQTDILIQLIMKVYSHSNISSSTTTTRRRYNIKSNK